MGDEKKDKEYAEGVKDALKNGPNEDFAHDVGNAIFPSANSEIYEKGYAWGRDHRNDSSQKDRGSGTVEAKSSSGNSSGYERSDDNYNGGGSYGGGGGYSGSVGSSSTTTTGSESSLSTVGVVLVLLLTIAGVYGLWKRAEARDSSSSPYIKMVYPENGSVTKWQFSIEFQCKKKTLPYLIPCQVVYKDFRGNSGEIQGEYSSDYWPRGTKKFSWTPREPFKNGQYYVKIGRYDMFSKPNFYFTVIVPSSE